MFKNVAFGIIAASIVGTQVWIGLQYKQYLGELLERQSKFEFDALNIDWGNLEDIDKLKKSFEDF